MPDLRHSQHSTSRLVLLALGLAVVVAVVVGVDLASTNGFWSADKTLPWQALILVLLMVATATGVIINAFTATMRPAPARTGAAVAGCALALAIGLEASYAVGGVPLQFYFWGSLLGHAVYTYFFAQTFVGCLRLSGRFAALPVQIATGLVATTGVLGFIGQSWVPLPQVAAATMLVRDIVLALLPAFLLLAVTSLKSLRLDPRSTRQSIRLRLPVGSDQRLQLRTLVIATGGVAFSLLTALAARVLEAEDGARALVPLTSFSCGWLGLAYLAFAELNLFTHELRQGNVTALLAPSPARRFLKRHLTEQQAWAATAGLKTTNFVIDHDPGGLLHTELPASIMQIRSEEIQRCISEVLGPMFLHSHVAGPRVFGAVDPETAVRPCIDTLRMFACLYLDAGPLVERRIKGLTSLLPIVDPGLAKVMQPKDVSSLIRRNLWFFHFDFGWIDQHVIHTPRSTRYDVRLATLGSRTRHSMMSYLEKTGGVGNFVWLGPDARDRLLQEAPAMRNIIEACPIVIDDTGADEETLMFIIKFEQLIPRLQRYFDLDTMRKALLDFEPSQESMRLQSLLAMQITKARTATAAIEVLNTVTSVPWRGFREKDNALHLILAAYNQLRRIDEQQDRSSAAGTDPRQDAFHEKLIEAVRLIGYPSQILHNAQINKIALRDVAMLAQVASDPRHARFSEAWLLLATSDYQRYPLEQRREVLAFLNALPQNPHLVKEPLVQAKAVDALASLGRTLRDSDVKPLTEACLRFAEWHAQHAVDPDICCLFLDAQVFLKAQHGLSFELPAAAVHCLDTYFHRLTVELGASHPKVIGIMSRWQDVRARQVEAKAS